MQYKVTKKYERGHEVNCEIFRDLSAAKSYVAEHAQSDFAMKIKTVYRIYDFDDVIQEFDSSQIVTAMNDNQPAEGQGSQGVQSGASFRPSPLNTAPRPPGMPNNNWVENKDDKDKSK